MPKKYCVLLGNNFEDVEALTQIDLLRRAGVKLDIYGVGNSLIRSRSGIDYQTDHIFTRDSSIVVDDYDGILLPGGPGAKALSENIAVLEVVKTFYIKHKLVFAICAAPIILDRAGVLDGKKFTCYPGEIDNIHSGTRLDEKVVIDGNLITSQGVGTSLDAAIKLVEVIVSKEEAERQAKSVLYSR